MMQTQKVENRPTGPKARTTVFANSVVASAGAGLATIAATGTLWPALVIAAVGAVVGFTVTNQIPHRED